MLTHYFYFPDQITADKAAGELRALGWDVEVRRAALGTDWLVRAMPAKVQPHDREDWETEFENLAKRFGGEYDGFEREVAD